MKTMKYISTLSNEYWYAVYNIGSSKTEKDANEIETFITNDKGKDKNNRFFSLDLYNIPCLDDIIASDHFYYDAEAKNSAEYASFLQYQQNLKAGKMDFFIYRLFFANKLTLGDCELNGKTVFQARTKTSEPYYGKIFLAEKNPLTPDKVIHWMEKLSVPLFGQEFGYEFADMPDKESVLKNYQEMYHKG